MSNSVRSALRAGAAQYGRSFDRAEVRNNGTPGLAGTLQLAFRHPEIMLRIEPTITSARPCATLSNADHEMQVNYGSLFSHFRPLMARGRKARAVERADQLVALSFSFLAARALRRSALAALASGAVVLLKRSFRRTALPERSRR